MRTQLGHVRPDEVGTTHRLFLPLPGQIEQNAVVHEWHPAF